MKIMGRLWECSWVEIKEYLLFWCSTNSKTHYPSRLNTRFVSHYPTAIIAQQQKLRCRTRTFAAKLCPNGTGDSNSTSDIKRLATSFNESSLCDWTNNLKNMLKKKNVPFSWVEQLRSIAQVSKYIDRSGGNVQRQRPLCREEWSTGQNERKTNSHLLHSSCLVIIILESTKCTCIKYTRLL